MGNGPPTIAATSTLAMVRTAEARGVETVDVLQSAGITRAFLDDPDARLPAPDVLAIWAALRERTRDPALQLTAPSTLPFGAYRVIDYLVAASATVGEGVHQFARFFSLIAEAVRLTIEDHAGSHALTLTMASGAPVPPVYVDYVFAALITRMRMRIRPTLQLQRVELRQPEPPAAQAYPDFFRARVRFAASRDQLVFADAEWAAPTATADAALARLLEEHARILAERTPRPTAGFQAVVEKALVSAPANSASAALVARALNVSVRTLQRKLVAAGTTFKEVSDSVRSDLAQGYLADSGVSIAEVAFLLGFSEQSSFNRAFHRWTGESPRRWRQSRGSSRT